jgi:hypothetical protein
MLALFTVLSIRIDQFGSVTRLTYHTHSGPVLCLGRP